MRPCSSSWTRMLGILLSTLVLRRFDQKPSSMVTARTGTLCSLAYGEFERFRTPWSRQGNIEADPAATSSANAAGCAERRAGLPSANESAGRASREAAVEVTAVERNRRRETSWSEPINHLVR